MHIEALTVYVNLQDMERFLDMENFQDMEGLVLNCEEIQGMEILQGIETFLDMEANTTHSIYREIT